MSLYYFVHCIVFYSLFDARPWSGNVPRDRCLQGTGRCETEDTGIRENARADGLHQTDAINCTTRWTASILQYSCCHDTCCTTYPTTRPLRRWRCRPRHRPHNFPIKSFISCEAGELSILFSHAEMVKSTMYGKGDRKALDANKLGALREFCNIGDVCFRYICLY